MRRPESKSQRRRGKRRLQRFVQTFCLALFLLLLWQTAWPFAGWLVRRVPPDLFLRLDPLAMFGSALATRAWLAGGLGVMLALLATALIGRFFCGYVCPMGASIDLADHLVRGPGGSGKKASIRIDPHGGTAGRLKNVKYGLLCFTLLAGALGVSLVFWFAPIPLVTRFYALLLQPMLMAVAEILLVAARPVLDALDLTTLYYAQVSVPRYAQQLFVLGFFTLVFGAALLSPRFWCRYLCPAGAIFALFSWRPWIRRQVSDACVQCGLCQQRCPMGAISEDPRATLHGECVTCQLCVELCPVQAIRFVPVAPWRASAEPHRPESAFAPSRRLFLWSGLAGAGGALAAMTELHSPFVPLGKGTAAPNNVIRPPGALPETDFLARCVRCGECMKACPTNTLQPIGLGYGITGLFSPSLYPRRGPCEPTCRACGLVCPTGALRPLPSLAEKTSAKLGTARVLRWKCLAWEHQRKCLVCDEVCPYNAIELLRIPGNSAPVPVVHETRCAGCGFCEFHCPVREERAIVVEPMGALRLARGSYADAAKAEGLELSLVGHGHLGEGGQETPALEGYPDGYGPTAYESDGQRQPAGDGYGQEQGLPPGFSNPEGDDELPPGFSNPSQ